MSVTLIVLAVICGAMVAAVIPVFAVILAFPGKWVGKTLGLIVWLTALAWAGGSVGFWFLFQACSGGALPLGPNTEKGGSRVNAESRR